MINLSKYSHIIIVIIVGLLLCITGCNPQSSPTYFPHDSSDLRPDGQVEYGRLENGLRFAVMSNSLPSNTASLLMHIDTGSINEHGDERGLAHFLEHMAFNGSANIPEGELIPRLEKYGLAFGPDTNASTDFTETIYQLELPEVNDDIMNETLMIMRETADRLLLDPQAIDKERGVILSEKRARESPGFHAFVDRLSFFLDGSLYPERLPIGTDDAIQSVTAQQFRDFYRGFYRPENVFIVLVGDFETDYAAEKIASHFADWTNEHPQRKAYEAETLPTAGLQTGYYVHPEIQTSVTLNVMREPDQHTDTAQNRHDFFVEGLGNRILSRRLARLAREGDAPFISAGAGSSNLYDIRGISSITLSSRPEKWADALAAGEQVLRQAYLYGFTQAELDEQIANTKKSLEVAVQTAPTRRTPTLARQILSTFSAENVFTAPEDNLKRFETYAQTITPEQVHETFKSLWDGYATPQIYLSTSLELDDPDARIKQILRDSQAVEVSAPDIRAAQEFAYTDFGPPGEVVSRETIEDIDIETVTFANNVRLNIKSTPYQKDVVSIRIIYGQGELSLPEDRPGLRWFAPNMLNLGGLEAHTADDIQTIMAGKSVGASFSLGTEHLFLNGSTTVDNLSDQLNLMTAYLTAPGFRDEARARYNKYIESFYPTLDSTPGGVASRDIDRIIRSDDPRFGIPTEDELLNISMDELKNWMDNSTHESGMEISVVGDIDADTVITHVARTLGALPARDVNLWQADPSVKILQFPHGQKRPITLTHAGEPETALLRIYWPAPDGRDIITTRQIGILSTIFRLKLTDILREESGASYSPGAFKFSPRTYSDYGYLGVSVEVSPDNIDAVAAKIRTIAAQLKSGQIDDDMFERAIRPVRERVENSLENNGYWLGIIARAQSDPEVLDRHRSRAKAYDTMELKDIKAVAAQQFDPDTSVTFYILPET